MSNYTEIEDVRKRGFADTPPSDDDIETAITLASELIDSWCCQDFDSHEDDEIIADGNDGDRMIFGKRIIIVTELEINKSIIPEESIVLYPGSAFGEIALKDGYRFYRGNGNIILKADTGWDSIPGAIKEASTHLAAMIINRQLFSGRPEIAEMESESLLDYSRKRMEPSEIKGIIDSDSYLTGLLRPYRLKGVLL